jgi:predicted ferric reductase
LLETDELRVTVSGYKRFHAGQHAFLYIPSVSWFQMHPFSLIPASDGSGCSVIVEVVGKWSKGLMKAAASDKPRYIWVDGPYGQLTLPLIHQMKRVVLVAGGVGITPIIGILQDLLTNAVVNQKITLIWSFRNVELFHELEAELADFERQGAEKITLELFQTGQGEDLQILSQEMSDPGSSTTGSRTLHHGRAELGPIFRSIAGTIKKERTSLVGEEVGVFVCGSRSLRNGVLRAARPTAFCRFVVHSESFSP